MKNIILIDYENLQVQNLDDVFEIDSEICVFIGALQKKVSALLVQSAQKFGNRLRWIPISLTGDNALDFHIAYYLGQMSLVVPKPFFHIVSKDTGFDALINYMKGLGFFIDRVESMVDIPLVKKMKEIKKDPVGVIKAKILTVSKPAKLKTLQSAIKKWLEVSDDGVANEIIDSLKKKNFLDIDEKGKVTYL